MRKNHFREECSGEQQIAFVIDKSASPESIFEAQMAISPHIVVVGTDASSDELEQLVKVLPSRFLGDFLNAIGSVMENR